MKKACWICFGFFLIPFLHNAQGRLLTQGNPYSISPSLSSIRHCQALPSFLSIRNILVGSQGEKYLASKRRGVIRIQDCSEAVESKVPLESAFALALSPQQEVWAALAPNRLLNTATGEEIVVSSLENELFVKFLFFHQDLIWIGSIRNALQILKSNGRPLPPNDPRQKIMDLLQEAQVREVNDYFLDQQGKIWLATDQGIFIVEANLKSIKRLPFTQGKYFKAICGSESHIWVSSFGELWKLAPKQTLIEKIDLNRELGSIEDLLLDLDQQLWIAADVLAVYHPNVSDSNKKLDIYDNQAGFNSRKALSLALDQNNTLWVGTSGSGVYTIQNAVNNPLEISNLVVFNQEAEALNATLVAAQADILEVSFFLRRRTNRSQVAELNFSLVGPSSESYALVNMGPGQNYTFDGVPFFMRRFRIDQTNGLLPGNYSLQISHEGKVLVRQNIQLQ